MDTALDLLLAALRTTPALIGLLGVLVMLVAGAVWLAGGEDATDDDGLPLVQRRALDVAR